MTSQWKDLSPEQIVALKGYGGEPGIYVRASMLRAMKGDGSAAIYVTQLLYWSQSDSAKKNEGWFYLTTPHVTKELGMSRYVQERVRLLLSNMGILEMEKRGLPAKNWYRLNLVAVLEKLTEVLVNPAYQQGGNPLSVGGDAPDTVGGETPHIVNTPVKIYSKKIETSASPARKPAKINVLEDRFDSAVAFIRQNYPLNYLGLPVTDSEARRTLDKLGTVKASATAEERQEALDKLNEFRKAVVNIRDSVASGDLETKYVPGFAKFAGLGVSFGSEPAYKKWALKVKVEKKPTLVV